MEGGRGFQPPEIKNHQSPTTNETQAANNKVNITGAASESKYEGISTTDKVESDAKDPVLPIVYGTTANGNDVKGLDIKQGDRNGEEVVTSVRDEYLVTWQDEFTDPENPKNWPMRRRSKALFGMSTFVFMSVFTVSIVAPTLPAIASELHIVQPAVQQMVLSIYLLGFACGPLIASPLSEVYGRMRVVQYWNLLYLIFNAVCGVSRSKEAIIVLRFVSGLFGGATLGIGGGSISDMFRSHERGKGIAIYSWCSVLAPLFGVILGGFIAKYTTWRWAFFSSSLLGACVQLLGLVLLEETYPPLLLRRRKWKMIIETGDTRYYTKFDHLDNVGARVLSQNLIRPFNLLGTQPIVQVLALYNAFLYGNIYIFYADFVNLWTDRYHESVQIAGLNYISIAIASTIATVVYTISIDRIYRIMTRKHDGKGRPEFRIPVMVPGTLLLGVGMIWYGWSAQAKLHWIMPNIGCSLFVAGATVCTSSVNAYIVDTYGQYSASAIAAISVLRCVAGFTFPLFAPYMYQRLGYSWAATVLGLIALGIGIPAIGLLWKFGLNLRQRSPYASIVNSAGTNNG